MSESYRDLIVWQRGVQLSVALYRLTADFPRTEQFGLTSQLRRAGVSIPSNIAEGWGRHTKVDYRRFLAMARGSNMEVQTQLVIAGELDFGDELQRKAAYGLTEDVSRLLIALVRSQE